MEEAEHLARAIVVLDAGRIAAQGTADELKGPARAAPSTCPWLAAQWCAGIFVVFLAILLNLYRKATA